MKDQVKELSNNQEQNNIAIIGGGFSGATIAIHQMNYCIELFKQGKYIPPIAIQLIDQHGRYGKGTAYDRHNDEGTLNQPTNQMSPFSSDKESNHFTNWLNENGHQDAYNNGNDFEGREFVKRKLYGCYVTSILNQKIEELKSYNLDVKVEMVKANITSVNYDSGEYVLQEECGQPIHARSVVFAMGHRKSTFLQEFDNDKRYFSGVCNTMNIKQCIQQDRKNFDHEGAIAIVGTGQSMMDNLMALLDSGYTGTIHAISRYQVEPWPFYPENYDNSPDQPYVLQHFTLDKLTQENNCSFENMYTILKQEFDCAKASGYDIGHVLGTINFKDYKATSQDNPETIELKKTVYNLCTKVYGNPTSPEKYERYVACRDIHQLNLVQGEVIADNIKPHTEGFTISGLNNPEIINVRYLFNGASFDRDPANDPLVRLMMNKNILSKNEYGDLVPGEGHTENAFLAGILHIREKWGVGTFRENNENIACQSIDKIIKDAPPQNGNASSLKLAA